MLKKWLSQKWKFFAGAELHYRDIFYGKIYEVLVNVTPGLKWNMGKQWKLAGQAIIPVYNDYGDRYKKIRLNMAVLSKEWDWNGKQFLKVSGGLFGKERYGLDTKWMYLANRWLALDAQMGVTGFCSMAVDWECSKMERVTGQAGVLPISPLFKKNLRVIAEYTGDDVNVGFDWKLWKHLLIQSSLQNGKYFSGGVCFCINLL